MVEIVENNNKDKWEEGGRGTGLQRRTIFFLVWEDDFNFIFFLINRFRVYLIGSIIKERVK